MFPEGTPEQDLLEALLEIERKPPGERTAEEAAQMDVVEGWYVDTALQNLGAPQEFGRRNFTPSSR